jgi:8-amino-7-oxononanoate synthase
MDYDPLKKNFQNDPYKAELNKFVSNIQGQLSKVQKEAEKTGSFFNGLGGNLIKAFSAVGLIDIASRAVSGLASALAALEILQEQPELVKKLNFNAEYVRSGLKDMGYDIYPSRTAIVSAILSSDVKGFQLWKGLFEAGIFVNVFVPPAAPPGMAMMRNSFMASHEVEHLDIILDTYKKIGKQIGLI